MSLKQFAIRFYKGHTYEQIIKDLSANWNTDKLRLQEEYLK